VKLVYFSKVGFGIGRT